MSGESITANLLKNYFTSRAQSVDKVASNVNSNNSAISGTKKITTFEYNPTDKQQDVFVSNNTTNKGTKGYTVSGTDLSGGLTNALKEVGGEKADLSKVWVQDNGDNKVTYGFNDSDGNKIYVRYQLDEKGNATEIKRTVQGKDGSSVSTDAQGKVDSTEDIDSKTMDKIQNALGSSYDYSTAEVLGVNKDGSTTYHVKDAQGNDAWVRYDINGNETARTIETQNNERYSIYAENDERGTKGKTTFVQRQEIDGKLIDIEGTYLDSDKVTYQTLTDTQSELNLYNDVYGSIVDTEELEPDIANILEALPSRNDLLNLLDSSGSLLGTIFGEYATEKAIEEIEEAIEKSNEPYLE